MKTKYIVSTILSLSILVFSQPTFSYRKADPSQVVKNPSFESVDKLYEEQKYQAAHDKVEEIYKNAKSKKDDLLATEALIRLAQFKVGLHKTEEAVTLLRDEQRPTRPESRVLVDLYYAIVLMSYYEMYSWEIQQREKVADGGKDLKSWTKEDISKAILKSLNDGLTNESLLSAPAPEFYKFYVVKNTFPKDVRPTLKDLVVYTAVDHLGNSSYWTAKESNEVYSLPHSQIIKGGLNATLVDSSQHPLLRMASLLQTHRVFHANKSRIGAALEAQYVLIERMLQHVTSEPDKAMYLNALAVIQKEPGNRKHEWWAKGQALWAERIMNNISDEDRNIKALAVLEDAIKSYPQSYGAQRALYLKQQIVNKHFSIQGLQQDGEAKNSLQVQYKNISKLYFRAYSVDFRKFLETAPAGEIWQRNWSDDFEKQKWGKPVAEWANDLAPTPDYLEHKAFLKHQLQQRGGYVIVVSTGPNFDRSAGHQVDGIPFVLTDIVLQRWSLNNGKADVRAVSGETGLPLAGVEVSNWSRDDSQPWQKPARKRATEITDSNGFVSFSPTAGVNDYFQVAQKGESFAFLDRGWMNPRNNGNSNTHRILVFTDRRIFRPGQKIYWKVLDYQGLSRGTSFAVSPKEKLVVELQDANRKVVGTKSVTTNEYGTASGEFTAAKDKALGNWQLVIKRGNDRYAGYSYVRVEEYKRPTFEVTIKDSLQALRLNKNASIGAEARYYFGQPVSSGKIKWRVDRTPIWSYWWYGYRGSAGTETVATGNAKLAANGSFHIDFTPKADEREAKTNPGLKYQFTLHADVTDDGGETREASKTIVLGFVSLDAQIQMNQGFYLAGKPLVFPVTLSDLNGSGKKGSGQWKIVKLNQPEKSLLPSEIPDPNIKKKKYSTADDLKRPRWETSFDANMIMQTWPEGQEVAQGNIEHDGKGKGELKLISGLKEGPYLVIYKSKDEFGAELVVKNSLIIGGLKNNISVPLIVAPEKSSYEVGETARVLIASGLKDQPLTIEIYSNGEKIKRNDIKNGQMLEIPITEKERGGFSILVTGLRDYQTLRAEIGIHVPWTNKQLKVEMATFRDKIRPGSKETFKITVRDSKGKFLGPAQAELLAFMYDRSLDFFGPHYVDTPLSSYPQFLGVATVEDSLKEQYSTRFYYEVETAAYVSEPQGDALVLPYSYGIGGPGERRAYKGAAFEAEGAMYEAAPPPADAMAAPLAAAAPADKAKEEKSLKKTSAPSPTANTNSDRNASDVVMDEVPLRSDFNETAFWKPHLLLDKEGSVSFEFQVPDSLTSWNFWANAITKDIRAGSFNGQTQSVKELMVRPYLPRFLREGDEAQVKVMINNAGDKEMSGDVRLVIENPETGKSAHSDFGLTQKDLQQGFKAPKQGSTTAVFSLKAPRNVGAYAISVKANTKGLSDGEKRLLPILPSRMHLAQSRFVTLRNKDQKTMEFKDLAKNDDPSLINDRMVLTIDAQLFYGVLKSVPYLINYPYECAEQTLNRFLSTGIITEVFKKYPSVQKMAKEFSKRDTPLEQFDAPDANQRMLLEESPWLQIAEGGKKPEDVDMVKVLDSRIVLSERDRALSKLRKMQNSDGGFPWFDGGRPDEYITLYLLIGFARAQEFNITIPKDMVVKGWKFLKTWSDRDLKKCMALNGCHELVTMVNYALTSYKDESWTGGVFTNADQKKFLDYSFAAWKNHSPLIKGYLTLTLKRMDRKKDAELVWASVMDSAKSTDELGTYWAPEERSWLWYNDTIESHAFALRVQMEMAPKDKKNDGLVQWLFLNKKLNHWKSTKATAESIYSLVHYMEQEKSLGVREEVTASFAGQEKKFIFEPEKYSGAKNQMVVEGDKIQAGRDSKITVSKTTPGFAFASSTWHFSTEKVPTKGDGDMFEVSRKYFLREKKGTEWTLKLISNSTPVNVGDQVEVQVSLRAKHAAEYVHLRDPRGAGFEPEEQVSGYKYDLGLSYYQEVRDSGGNFFFNRLPVGQYTFKYRVRANMAGTFRVGPATVQSLYAPEFNAYSQGEILKVVQ